MRIKNLILDLGGVLYDLDYSATESEFEKIGFSTSFSRTEQSDLIDLFEEGKLSPIEFAEGVSAMSARKEPLSLEEVTFAWNKMLLGIKPRQWELLTQLKSKYNLYLYSNTNAIHIEAVWQHIKTQHGKDGLNDYFLKIYLSNVMGIRKPKTEGFDVIVEENKLVREETMFVDDSPQHVEGAMKSGIKALWLDLEVSNLKTLLQKNDLL